MHKRNWFSCVTYAEMEKPVSNIELVRNKMRELDVVIHALVELDDTVGIAHRTSYGTWMINIPARVAVIVRASIKEELIREKRMIEDDLRGLGIHL